MQATRILKHLLTTSGSVKRAFPAATLAAIEAAIQASESMHAGQIRFVVEGALDGAALFAGPTARERAIELFSLLRIWDTEHNSGLLIYLLLADRAVEIVADRGIDAKVGAPQWAAICSAMEAAFRQSRFEQGALAGLQAVTQQLVAHFPAAPGQRDELPNKPLLL